MSHTIPIYLRPNKEKTVAFYSMLPPRRLIIFVHGFGGNATGTWDEFSKLKNDHERFTESDIIFYGYPSLQQQVNNNALIFKKFILDNQKPTNDYNDCSYRNITNESEYESIVLVGHSLGAIIIRRALLTLKQEGGHNVLLDKIKMLLFAPAHKGTLIKASYISGPTLLGVLGSIGIYKTPSFSNLQSNSATITSLLQDTQHYIDIGDFDFTIAAKVIWANEDQIVENDRFFLDPVAIPEEGSHTSICKPIEGVYMNPFNHLFEILI